MAARRKPKARTRSSAFDPAAVTAASFGHEVRDLRALDTHISWVFLTGNYAYKVKKPVDFGFIDFTTLARRRRFCEDEVRLNRRTAPEWYLGVVPVARDGDGWRFDAEPAAEWAVRMRQFPEEARLDRRLDAGRIDADILRAAGEAVGRFHDALPPEHDPEGERALQRIEEAVFENFEHLERLGTDGLGARRDRLARWSRKRFGVLEPTFRCRAAAGRTREGHGDLHLANLFLHEGRVVPFDCIEFNADFRWVDIASDAAFLAMDLARHDRWDLACAFLDAWLAETGDYEALRVLRFYLAYRAVVRAKVAALHALEQRGDQAAASRQVVGAYLDLAERLGHRRHSPLLVITHGLSGSGKSWRGKRLVTELPALRVRSDVERKRLFGVPTLGASGSGVDTGLYTADATRATYDRVAECCRLGLEAGFDMIADASFLDRDERERFAALARRCGARFAILDCRAPMEVLRTRVARRAQRGDDASEATLDVLDRQRRRRAPLSEAEAGHTVMARPGDELTELAVRLRAMG